MRLSRSAFRLLVLSSCLRHLVLRCGVPPVVSLCVSSCRLALHLIRLARASRPSSRHVVSSWHRAVSSSRSSSRRAKRPCVAFLVVLLYRLRPCVVPQLRRPASPRLVLRCVGRGGVAFVVPCRRAFSAVSFHLFVVGVRRLVACGIWEIELTKTARFAVLVIFVSSSSCSSCRGDMRIGPGRTVVRQETVVGLFERPACRICPPVVSANRFSRPLIPRPGGGGTN